MRYVEDCKAHGGLQLPDVTQGVILVLPCLGSELLGVSDEADSAPGHTDAKP